MEHNQIQLAPIDELVPLMCEQLDRGGAVTFTPRGISMYPMLRHGMDAVTLLTPPKKIKKYDIIFYRRNNGKYVLHRVVGTGNSFTCIGDNQYCAEKGIMREQIIAVVSGFTRSGKEYSIDSLGYRLYCRMWHYSRFPRRVLRFIKRKILNFFGKR